MPLSVTAVSNHYEPTGTFAPIMCVPIPATLRDQPNTERLLSRPCEVGRRGSAGRPIEGTSCGDGPGQARSLPGDVPYAPSVEDSRTGASTGTGGELTQTLIDRFLQPLRLLTACCSLRRPADGWGATSACRDAERSVGATGSDSAGLPEERRS